MTNKEKEIIMINFKITYFLQIVTIILIGVIGLFCAINFRQTGILVDQANRSTIKDIKSTADGITTGAVEGWSLEYVKGSYESCNRAVELGVVEECKIIGDYLEGLE
jgi:hypothetical protein